MRSSIKTLTVAALTADALVAAPAAFAEPTTTNDVVQTAGGGALLVPPLAGPSPNRSPPLRTPETTMAAPLLP